MRLTLFTGFFLLFSVVSNAQTAGDYRSIISGDWSNASRWQRFNGVSWVAAGTAPSSSDNVITIQSAHTITIPNGLSVTADQIVLEGDLIIAVGGTLTIVNGAGADMAIADAAAVLTVNGTLDRKNLTDVSNPFSASNILFNSGSNYYHNYTTTVGDLPLATWDAESNLNVTGFTNTTPITGNSTWDQTLGNLIFNSVGQRSLVNFSGSIKTIKGDLTVLSTGSNVIQFSGAEDMVLSIGDANSNIGGDVVISGTARVTFSTAGTDVINVYGDFNFSSGNTYGTHLNNTGSTVVNLYGDFVMSAGTFGKLRLATAGTTGNTALNIYNDFSLNSGRIDETGSNPSQGNINFVGTGTQHFVNSGTISGYINYYVAPSTTLDVSIYPLTGTAPSAFVLDGTLRVGSLDAQGAIYAGSSVGNLRTPPATRVYNAGSTIIYSGTGPQFMGSGHPTSADITTVVDNASGVTMVNNLVFSGGVLRLQNGTFNLNDLKATFNQPIETINGEFGGSGLSGIIIQGTGDDSWGTLSFEAGKDSLALLTLDRTGTNVSATIAGTLTIAANLNLTNGTLQNNGTLTMADSSVITRYETAFLTGNAPMAGDGPFNLVYKTKSPFGGPYATITTGSELPGGQNDLLYFIVACAQTADAVNLTKNIYVNGNFTLTKGTFSQLGNDITMRGTNWDDNGGSFVPGTGTVIFDSDSTRVYGSANPVLGNIQINAGRKVEFARTFLVHGNIDFQPGSEMGMSTNTMILSGGNSQVISANGATFSNISLAKSGSQGVILTSPLNLTGILQFVSPSVNVNLQSNGNLTLISSSDQDGNYTTATLYRLISGNQVSGSVDVQRYMSGEGKIYRYISSPVATATVAQLQDDFLVQGNFADPSPTQNICGVKASSSTNTLFWYDESAAGPIGQGYTAYPTEGNTAAGSPLEVGRGYAAYIRQCTLPTIIDYQGVVNQGLLNLPVTYTVSDPSADGWNLVGNPYPSTIDWDLTAWTKARISTMIAVTDNGSGMTRYYDAGVTEEIPNGQIASGQGFWVRATAANPVLTIRENVKVTNVAEYYRERPASIPSLTLALSHNNETDYAYVKTVTNALPGLDEYDAPKILNPNFNISTLSADSRGMAINAIEKLGCGDLQLVLQGLNTGVYTVTLNTKGNFSDLNFVLFDAYTGTTQRLVGRSYTFEVNGDVASAATNRLKLSIESGMNTLPKVVSPIAACEESAVVLLENVTEGDSYSIWNSEGREIAKSTKASESKLTILLLADSLSSGANTLTVKHTNGCFENVSVSSFSIVKPEKEMLVIEHQFNCDKRTSTLKAVGSDLNGYRWYETEESSKVIFEGIEFETPVLSKDKTYYVESISSATGCVSDRVPAKTEMVSFDPPKLEVSGMVLTSNYETGNNWFYNGQVIPGEFGSSITMDLPGIYEVKVTKGSCVSMAAFTLDDAQIPGIRVFPNPVIDVLRIQGIDQSVEQIELGSPLGQSISILFKKGQKFEDEFSLRSIPDGLYLLVVTIEDRKYTYRIIKRTK
jgi:hypothetical protein